MPRLLVYYVHVRKLQALNAVDLFGLQFGPSFDHRDLLASDMPAFYSIGNT